MATEAQKILRTLYDAGCTDGEMAEASGIHRVTICKIRNGQLSGDRSLPKLRAVAQDVGVDLGDMGTTVPRATDTGTGTSAARRQQQGTSSTRQPQSARTASAAVEAEAEAEEDGSSGLLVALGVGAAAVVGFLGGMWYQATHLAGGL